MPEAKTYEVLARKWRPQQFQDVVGQDHVTQTLRNAITSDRVAHAYLFVGPRGIGKTSLARILAKALNCETGITVSPCDTCAACTETMAGINLDVLEIDGASNNGVDQVRDLRDNVKYSPARGPFKVYIIDEVHMLTSQAFNALLKTLEEPPPHVKFIFATTEPQKILPTILSRCQRFDLRRIPTRLIVERLARIAEAEQVHASEDALLAVARGADGGMRDATSALDQLISFRGTQIEEEDVLSVFGLVARRTLEALARDVLASDIPGMLGTVAELDIAGKDMQRVVLELLAHFRHLLLALHVDVTQMETDLTDAQVSVLQEQAEGMETDQILAVTEILMETENRLRYAVSKRALLETALIRSARAANLVSIESVLDKIEQLQQKSGTGSPSQTRRDAEPSRPAPPKKKEVVADREPRDVPEPGHEVSFLSKHWPDFLDRVGKSAPLARNMLADAKPAVVEGDRVVIGFDQQYEAQIGRLDMGRNRNTVQREVDALLQRRTKVQFAVLGPDGSIRQPGAPSGKRQEEPAPKRRSPQEWLQEPAVQSVLEMFDGTIVDVQ